MSNFLLIDINNLMHRCRNTQHSGDIETDAGLALHVSLNAIKSAWRRFNIEHLVFCLEGRSWRRDVYKEYKANRDVLKLQKTEREKRDDEYFYGVFQIFTNFVKEKSNASYLQNSKAEADDFIARWIQLHPDDNHFILSGDSDFYQLLADNVTIYDGVKGWTITDKQVVDENNKPVKKTKTVTRTVKGKTIKSQETYLVEAPNPEYELFFKIIRGDSSDNIMSAYPGVREFGSMKKPGVREAFADRQNKGFDWNNFMLQEWDKLVGITDTGEPLMEKVRVTDQYKINEELIDLTKQPDYIKDILDNAILEEVQKDGRKSVGFAFMKFAGSMDLISIAKTPMEFSEMFNAGYPK